MSRPLSTQKPWHPGGVWFGRRQGVLKNLVIEGDSLQILGALADPSPNCSSIAQLVEDTKAFLPSITEDLCSMFIAKQTQLPINQLGSHCEWLPSPPNFILDLPVEDCL
ncbi:hypothetical protein DVH24_007647 [Malus domestica]|uniref:RNase H type-1 domain-containing protein n=1 Tax=Malus domestica TaxID=3750 RepID=A0A498HMJ6_MALDO|nr:hypothetical protein DVH24_007647 [Malus domestica]